jgi:hypothetical protein
VTASGGGHGTRSGRGDGDDDGGPADDGATTGGGGPADDGAAPGVEPPVETGPDPGVPGRLLAGLADQPVLGAFVVLMLLMALGFLVAGLLVLT